MWHGFSPTAKARQCIRKHIITTADRSLGDCLCEFADNILRGNVSLTKLQTTLFKGLREFYEQTLYELDLQHLKSSEVKKGPLYADTTV